jgi:hypothetical protein
VRHRHGVADLAQAYIRMNTTCRRIPMAVALHQWPATMTSDQYRQLCRVLAGATVRALQRFRDVPRASVVLPIVQAIERERAQPVLHAF